MNNIMYVNEKLWKLGVIIILCAIIFTATGALLTLTKIPDNIMLSVFIIGLLFFALSGIIVGVFKYMDYKLNKQSKLQKEKSVSHD